MKLEVRLSETGTLVKIPHYNHGFFTPPSTPPLNVCLSIFTAIIKLLLTCNETLRSIRHRSQMKC